MRDAFAVIVVLFYIAIAHDVAKRTGHGRPYVGRTPDGWQWSTDRVRRVAGTNTHPTFYAAVRAAVHAMEGPRLITREHRIAVTDVQLAALEEQLEAVED